MNCILIKIKKRLYIFISKSSKSNKKEVVKKLELTYLKKDKAQLAFLTGFIKGLDEKFSNKTNY